MSYQKVQTQTGGPIASGFHTCIQQQKQQPSCQTASHHYHNMFYENNNNTLYNNNNTNNNTNNTNTYNPTNTGCTMHTNNTSRPNSTTQENHHICHYQRCVQGPQSNNTNNNNNRKHASGKQMTNIPRPLPDWDIPGRYEIHHLIGTGSYGHVCEAYDQQEKRVVAIKKIHRVFEDLIDCKRILREIAILSRLNHQHIVKILDIIVPPDLEKFDELYVVLEIADSDFKKLFRTPVHLTELHIKTLLYNLLVGVKYVHSAGILHRDLKPANCLVNQDCSVRVCDFGLARTMDFPEGLSHQNSSCVDDDMNLVSVPHTKNLKRQLTGHVVTRWYRAPELILLQEHYTEAIDVWSIGCIFSELLNMIKENVRSHCDRGPLFPGSSCFPLSPEQKNAEDYDRYQTRGNRDQLSVIFTVLGTPDEEDIQALEKEDARKYIRFFSKKPATDLAQRFSASSAEALDLLKRMLVFNPSKRISIEDCLIHPFFKDVRNKEVEVTAAEKISLPFNDWTNMEEPQLRVAFIKEIQRYHPDVKIPPSIESKTNSNS